MDEITAPNYVTAITTGLSYLESKNIHFGTVIVDNATAQAKAFKYTYRNSLRYKAKSKLIRNVLVIFCACHKVHNAFKTTLEHNVGLGAMSDVIHSIADDARKFYYDQNLSQLLSYI